MAKKKTVGRPATEKLHASHLRRGDHTPADLREQAALLRKYAADLVGVADQADSEKLEAIAVDGTTKMDRGLGLIRDFLVALKVGLLKSQRHQL